MVPIKPLALAKSRLALPREKRRGLALAFALDTITALTASRWIAGVVVVTADPDVVRRLGEHPAHVAHDGGDGLGPAVRDGIAAARNWRPDSGVLVVPADLPCLRPDDLARVMAAAAGADGAFVPDRSGTGTTLVVYPPERAAVTHYGPGSADLHRALGLRVLSRAPIRARHDVDTLEDLRAAVALGVGPATGALLDR